MRRFPLLALVVVAACASPADQGPGRDLLGAWRYTATQSAPTASLTGTFTVTTQTGSAFGGRLEVQETDAAGVLRSRAGAVSGRAPASLSVDFDVLLGTAPRRHVARVVADTMEGNWVETGGTSITTGVFRAVRIAGQ